MLASPAAGQSLLAQSAGLSCGLSPPERRRAKPKGTRQGRGPSADSAASRLEDDASPAAGSRYPQRCSGNSGPRRRLSVPRGTYGHAALGALTLAAAFAPSPPAITDGGGCVCVCENGDRVRQRAQAAASERRGGRTGAAVAAPASAPQVCHRVAGSVRPRQ